LKYLVGKGNTTCLLQKEMCEEFWPLMRTFRRRINGD